MNDVHGDRIKKKKREKGHGKHTSKGVNLTLVRFPLVVQNPSRPSSKPMLCARAEDVRQRVDRSRCVLRRKGGKTKGDGREEEGGGGGGENLVGRGPPPLSKALALCHVAPHNEAARWVSVIAAPGPVFCLPWNGLLCREPVLHRPPAIPSTPCQETILYSRLGLHVRDTPALYTAFVGGC